MATSVAFQCELMRDLAAVSVAGLAAQNRRSGIALPINLGLS